MVDLLIIPNLASLRLGGSQFPVFECSRSPENLREPRKFAAIVVQGSQSRGAIHRALGPKTGINLPQRAQRAQKRVGIRRGGFETRPLGVGASESLRKLRKLAAIVVHAFSQTALGNRGSPVGEQPQPKI